MTSKVYVDYVTPVDAASLNDFDTATYVTVPANTAAIANNTAAILLKANAADSALTGTSTIAKAIVGDQGTEGSGINIGGVTYESTLKVSDIDGTNFAQTILHRHSTILEPLILGARSNSNTSAHTAVTNNQNLFTIYAAGWAGSNYKLFGSESFSSDATGTISDTSAPGKWSVSVTPNGGVAPVQAISINNAGLLSTKAISASGQITSTVSTGTAPLVVASTTLVANLHAATADIALSAAIYNYLSKCTMSTAGSSATMSISAGAATDSTNAVLMTLTAIAKTTSAWAVGTATGGLDTGSIANSTWYYFYVIRRPDTGVVDVVFSTSSTAPTLPTNYTQYRYIGAGKTNGSGQWTKFTQFGRDFFWDTPIQDYATAGSATAQLLTCTIPLGRKMKVSLNIAAATSGGSQAIYVSDPDNADLAPPAPGTSGAPSSQWGFSSGGGANLHANGNALIWTNTSGQVRHREISTVTTWFVTLGWTDLADKE